MLVLLVAALATSCALPMVVFVLRWRSIVDVPNQRSSHAKPVYRGGGLACLVGVACGLAVAQLRGDSVLWGASAVAVGIGIVGLIDDIRALAPVPRLAAQASVGAVAGWLVGDQLLAAVAGLVVLLITVNVVNFMDGINGISGLTVGLWGVTAMLLGTVHHSHALVTIGAVTAGAALGFLPANLPNARLFLGDVGSYLLGGLVTLGVLVGARDGVPLVALAAPLSVYFADTTYTLIRRAISREPLLSAHRQHIYQRLVSDARISHTMVALLTAATAGVVTACWLPGLTLLAATATAILLSTYLCSVAIVCRLRLPATAPTRGGPA